jgi:hypothetical protein
MVKILKPKDSAKWQWKLIRVDVKRSDPKMAGDVISTIDVYIQDIAHALTKPTRGGDTTMAVVVMENRDCKRN